MNPHIKEEWIKELRSNKYHKVEGYLHKGNGYRCALGVLVDIYAKYHQGKARWIWTCGSYQFQTENGVGEWKIQFSNGKLPIEVREWAGLQDSDPKFTLSYRDKKLGYVPSITQVNDVVKEDFQRIADRIEFGTLVEE